MLERLLVIFSIIALILGAWIFVFRSADPENFYLDGESPSSVMDRPFADWVEFDVPQHGFRVRLPAYPTSAESEVEVPGVSQAVLYKLWATQDLSGAAYSVNVVIYPPELDLSRPYEAMDALLNDVLKGSGADQRRLVEVGDLDGHPQMSFTVEGSESRAGGQMVLRGRKLYLIFYLNIPGNFDESTRDYFVESFAFTG